VFELDESISPSREHSYNNWLARQDDREIHT
jgi:hypothetical protein